MLDQFSQEQLKQKSMLELASIILKDAKKAIEFKELYDQIAEIKGFSAKEKENKIAQFYTELNVDGRFVTLGSQMWGLKAWYPIDQVEEEIPKAPKKRKTKKKVEDEDDEDLDFEDDDELLELGEEDEDDEDEDEDDDDLEEVDEFDEDEEEVFDDEELEDDDELDVEIDPDEDEE